MVTAFPYQKLEPPYSGVTGPPHTIDLATLQGKELVTTDLLVRTHRLALVIGSPTSPGNDL